MAFIWQAISLDMKNLEKIVFNFENRHSVGSVCDYVSSFYASVYVLSFNVKSIIHTLHLEKQ